MTNLDQKIQDALRRLGDNEKRSFDYAAYIAAFQQSARDKAACVLQMLANPTYPVSGLKPVFVSVGGGDAEELDYLLRNSDADMGILIEFSRTLADIGRKRQEKLPHPKRLVVLEGDAQQTIGEAIRLSCQEVMEARAGCQVVTCHAVLHELFDRGKERFDPLGFFATIFQEPRVSTLFTYREPGAPEKWPVEVLLRANCSQANLLALAEAIRKRHEALRTLTPPPMVVGDATRMHRDLAMEVLAKVFYIDDLPHEIEERSTAVNHRHLTNSLWAAIGDDAPLEQRAYLTSYSAPTSSFIQFWQKLGIDIQGINADYSKSRLAIAESHTRIVAWRLSSDQARPSTAPVATSHSPQETPPSRHELVLARRALQTRDDALLSALLTSHGRAWIESPDREHALRLFADTLTAFPRDALLSLWCHYLRSIAALFAGERISPDLFSEDYEQLGAKVGIGALFRAERMEFSRKCRDLDTALLIANDLRPLIDKRYDNESSLDKYAHGTVLLLLANFLRAGGRYSEAWETLDKAQHNFRAGIDSHDTEIAHCYYGKGICIAMSGMSDFEMRPDLSADTQQFAGGLIRLSFSHASWFIDDLERAQHHAREGAAIFRKIGAMGYAQRADQIAALLAAFDAARKRPDPNLHSLSGDLAQAIAYLLDLSKEGDWFANWFQDLRPSKAVGLLQFAKLRPDVWHRALRLRLPKTLEITGEQRWKWYPEQWAESLEQADSLLRRALEISSGRRLPLIAD